MSVATKNPFALLDAEGTSRPSSPPPTASAPISPPASAPSARNRDTTKPRGGPASRGGKYYQRGGKVPAPTDAPAATQEGTDEPAAKDSQRRFENGRGRGRGGRGAAPRGGRRPFDRHSATGKTDSDKKLHQGWGGDDGNAELKTEQQATDDAAVESNEWAADSSAADWGAPAAAAVSAPLDTDADADPNADKPDPGRPRRDREPEEDNTLTLDQYFAQQKEKEVAVPKLEGPREVDASEFKGLVPLEKGEPDSYFVGKAKSAPKARAKKEDKVFIEIDGHFDSPNRGRGRGRGGERGRGGGGGSYRGGRGGPRRGQHDAAVDVDDQTAFPSLS